MADSTRDIFTEKDTAFLERIQGVREHIIDDLTKDNKIPTTDEDRQFLLKAMSDAERLILSKTKIKSDDENNKNKNEIFEVITEILRQTNVVPGSDTTPPQRSLHLGSEHVLTNIVPGEMHIGIINETHEEFTKRRQSSE